MFTGNSVADSNFCVIRYCLWCCENGICANIAPGRSLKMNHLCPGKPGNFVFSSPGKSSKTVEISVWTLVSWYTQVTNF